MATSIKAIATTTSSAVVSTPPLSFPLNQTSLPKKVAQHFPQFLEKVQSQQMTSKRPIMTSASIMAPGDNTAQSNDSQSESQATSTNEAPIQSPTILKVPEHREIRIKLSYGHLAAKEWGNPDGLPVLAVHGWLDNAGSFDPLVPHILEPHNLNVVAFDEPGVGYSSHKPHGSEYGRWSTLKEMKRVIDYKKWKKVTIIGHSQGGHYSLLFAAVYPELVERVICLDLFKPITYLGYNWADRVSKVIELHMKYEGKYTDDPSEDTTVPTYSEPDAIKRMMEAHGNSLTEQTAKILMIRGTKRAKWGLTFSRDIRLKLPPIDPSPTDGQMLKFMERIRSDLLIIRAKQGPYHVPERIREEYYDIYRKRCPLFRDVLIDGTHHVHMNEPEKVGNIINQFLTDSLMSNQKSNL